MLERIITRLPDGWREVAELLAAPVAWVPRLQQTLLSFFAESTSPWAMAAKYLFLLGPVLLAVTAIWCTQLSLYTLPFRAGRGRFVSLLLLAWWDAARMTWMYWVGLVRMAAVGAGWILALAHLAVRLAAALGRQVLAGPVAVAGPAGRREAAPGVPWVACLMLVVWCVLEATVLAAVLRPTVAGVLADLIGPDEPGRLTGGILYLLLVGLILGSFAGLQALIDAVRRRQARFLAQIVLVEVVVMGFEVLFLYRPLADALLPWLPAAAGLQPGPGVTLLAAVLGWIGVRALTWLLFGQYGTPPLLAVVGRQPVADAPAAPAGAWWRPALAELEAQLGWLHERSEQLLEYLALPVLHLLGAALNFAMLLTTGRPAFGLPFRGLREVSEVRDLPAAVPLPPRKPASA